MYEEYLRDSLKVSVLDKNSNIYQFKYNTKVKELLLKEVEKINGKIYISIDEISKNINKIDELIQPDDIILEVKIKKELELINIKNNLEGYKYTIESLKIIFSKLKNYKDIIDFKKELYKIKINKEIFNIIAKNYHTSENTIDRCIRYMIEENFKNGNIEEQENLFKEKYNKISGKVTTKNYIYMIAIKIFQEIN